MLSPNATDQLSWSGLKMQRRMERRQQEETDMANMATAPTAPTATTTRVSQQSCDDDGNRDRVSPPLLLIRQQAQSRDTSPRRPSASSFEPKLMLLASLCLIFISTSGPLLAQLTNNQTQPPSDMTHKYLSTKQQTALHQAQSVSNSSSANTSSQQQSINNLINRTPPSKAVPFHHLHYDQLDLKTNHACEGTRMTLSCQEGKLINLVRANYGRFSLSICNENGLSNYSVICTSFRAFLDVQTMCNDRNNCSVTVSSELFGEPCAGTSKYLEVQYYCKDANWQQQQQQQPTPNNNNGGRTGAATPVISNRPAAPSSGHKSPALQQHVGGQQLVPTAANQAGHDNKEALLDSQQLAGAGATIGRGAVGTQATPATTTTLTTSGNNNSGEGSGANPNAADSGQREQSAGSTVIQQQQYCLPQMSARNAAWEATRAGQVARQACPEGSTGRASWLCDHQQARFTPPLGPDFSQCRSLWLGRLSQQLSQMLEQPLARQPAGSGDTMRQQDEQMIKSILGELSLMTKTKELFSEDLKRIDIMLGQMIAQLRSLAVLFGQAGQPGGQLAWRESPAAMYEELFVKLVQVISSLFDVSQRHAWLELNSAEARQRLEARLLNHLRDAGFMLAHSLPAEQLAELASVRQANIMAGIVVISRLATGDEATTSQLNLAAGAKWRPANNMQQSAYSLNQLFGGFGDESTAPPQQQQQSGAELRLQTGLLKELVTSGSNKFLILDIQKADFALIKQQLEQQLAGEPAGPAAQAAKYDGGPAGDQQQQHIFGVFPIIGETGDVWDLQQQQQQQTFLSADAKRSSEQLAQWPISVEFKLSPTTSINGNTPTGAPARQCHWLAAGGESAGLAPGAYEHHCHLARSNATNFVCACDRFGFVALTQHYPPPAGLQMLQNDQFQWPANTLASDMGEQLDARVSSFVVNKQQQQQQQQPALGVLATVFISLGVALLVLTAGGLLVSGALRLAAQSRLSKKQENFFHSLNGGTTSGPLADHHLMGSDPLVSGAATTQSASIIGLNTSANGPLCHGATGTMSHYKSLQQQQQQQLYAQSPPMLEAYAPSGRQSTGWPLQLVGRLLRKPAAWFSHSSATGHGLAAGKLDQGTIQHRLIGNLAHSGLLAHNQANGQNSNTLAGYQHQQPQHNQKNAYQQHQNGYTISLGLHQTQHLAGAHQQRRAQMSSTGSGQSVLPLNSSSNSSYVSSSAYYEEIDPTNQLAKVAGHQHTTIVDPFKRPDNQLGPISSRPTQFQVQQHHWPQTSNNNSISYSLEAQQQQQQQPQRSHASMMAKQPIHPDLSPLQPTNSSSSASGATTPRHYLFASPSAVSAYKQQQFRGFANQQEHQ